MRGTRRGILLAGGLALLLVVLVRMTGSPTDHLRVLAGPGQAGADPVGGLIAALALAAELLAAYLLAVLVIEVVSRLPGVAGRLAARAGRLVTAPILHRVLDGLLGAALLTQAALAPLPARAGTPVAGPPARRPVAGPVHGQGGWVAGRLPPAPAVGGSARPPALPPWVLRPGGPLGDAPARVVGDGAREDAAPPGPGPAVADRYVVVAGDSLWAIAARHLPAGSRDDAAVDRYWRLLYAANRRVVGDDPDRIYPGTRLEVTVFRESRR